VKTVSGKEFTKILEKKGWALPARENVVVPEQLLQPIKMIAGFMCSGFKKTLEAISPCPFGKRV
jgi:hypothetical protein